MRRILAGAFTLLASVALPATFEGTAFLVAMWVLLGLSGAFLILSSEPVKRPILAALRRELGIETGPAVSAGSTPAPPAKAEASGPSRGEVIAARLRTLRSLENELRQIQRTLDRAIEMG